MYMMFFMTDNNRAIFSCLINILICLSLAVTMSLQGPEFLQSKVVTRPLFSTLLNRVAHPVLTNMRVCMAFAVFCMCILLPCLKCEKQFLQGCFNDKLLLLKSFCLRDWGRLGNEGRPISLKIGTESRHVVCWQPVFSLRATRTSV